MPDSASETEKAVWRNMRADPRLGPDFRLDRVGVLPDRSLLLEGSVQTLAQKKLALKRAASTPGVSYIVDRLRVRAPDVSDNHIRAQLRTQFAENPDFCDLEVREDTAPGASATKFESVSGAVNRERGHIDIEVEHGVVTLNGRAPTLVRKRLAGALAWRVPGVRDVVNGLQVEPEEEDSPDEIEEAVRVVLDRDPGLDAAQIKVGVRNDVVRLSGLTASNAQRSAAEVAAWSVLGVTEVINEIQVRP